MPLKLTHASTGLCYTSAVLYQLGCQVLQWREVNFLGSCVPVKELMNESVGFRRKIKVFLALI